MTDTPDKGESLSVVRRRAASARWAKPATILPVIPTPLTLVVDNVPKPAKPAAVKKATAKKTAPPPTPDFDKRLAEVTNDAVAAFNAILAKPKGRLVAVSDVGIEKRRADVHKCIKVASRICQRLYDNPRITPEFWEQYFSECNKDDFLAGRQGGGPGHENWKPTFAYLTKAATMIDVFEKAMSRAG